MVRVEVKLDVPKEFLKSFLDELKHFDGKHYTILDLKVEGEKQK